MNSFIDGYRFFEKNASIAVGTHAGNDYIDSIQKEIHSLKEDINSFTGYKTDANRLKGDIAEFWHAGTFNIDAVKKDSQHRVIVDRSHGLGSADISSNYAQSYGLKYYADGAASAKQQAKSIFERYKEYQFSGGTKNLEEYLKENNISDNVVLSDPLYSGQIRVIPKNQIEEAKNWLERKIAKEAAVRPDQVKRYQETLDLLTDHISDNEGVKSISLSEQDAKKLAEFAKEGEFKPEEWELTTEQIIDFQSVLKRSLKAGMSAATISVVLKVAPEIYQAISYLMDHGYIDTEEFKKIGFIAVKGGAEGFLYGTIGSAVTSACKSGVWGAALKSVDPSFIGAVSVITMNMIQNAMMVAGNRMTREDLCRNLSRDVFVSACSVSLGLATQYLIHIPVFGYLLGSFVGSVAGSFLFTAAEKATISFCVESGFTMFGLVEQNYRLPDEVLKEIGIPPAEYKKTTYKKATYKKAKYKHTVYKKTVYKRISITFLRRGIISVSKIGYTTD